MVVMMMVAANIIGFGGRAAAGSSGIHTVDDTEEKRGGCAFIYLLTFPAILVLHYIAFILYNQIIDSILSDQYTSYLRIEIMKSFELWQLASGICVQCT